MRSINEIRSNPRVKYLLDRFFKTVELAKEKVAAHLQNPQQYPLPGNNTLERVLYNLVLALPEKRRKKFIDKHNDHIHAAVAKKKTTLWRSFCREPAQLSYRCRTGEKYSRSAAHENNRSGK